MFDHAAQIHDGHRIADMAYDAQVMGDEDVGQAQRFLQFHEQVEDLGLDRHVERGHGFVADQHLRFHGQGACDSQPLALTAGKLARIAIGGLRGKPHQFEQAHRLVAPCAPGYQAVMDRSLGDQIASPLAQMQRRHGVLEDHLHRQVGGELVASAEARDIPAFEVDRPRALRKDLRDHAPQCRFSASRFANDSKDLALRHRQGDVVDGTNFGRRIHRLGPDQKPPERIGSAMEDLGEILHLEDRPGGGVHLWRTRGCNLAHA